MTDPGRITPSQPMPARAVKPCDRTPCAAISAPVRPRPALMCPATNPRADDAEEGGDEGARRRGAALEQEAAVPDARALKGPRVVLGRGEAHRVRHAQLLQRLDLVCGRQAAGPAGQAVGVHGAAQVAWSAQGGELALCRS